MAPFEPNAEYLGGCLSASASCASSGRANDTVGSKQLLQALAANQAGQDRMFARALCSDRPTGQGALCFALPSMRGMEYCSIDN